MMLEAYTLIVSADASCNACCGGVTTVCCPDNPLPLTATATATVNGVTLSTFGLAAFATVAAATAAYAGFSSYYAADGAGYYAEIACPTDSDLLFHILIWCTAAGAWRFAFQVERVSAVAFMVSWFGGNDVVWLAGKGVVAAGTYSVACSPFHFHYEGNNTGSGSAATLCGFSYDGNFGSCPIVFDAVVP